MEISFIILLITLPISLSLINSQQCLLRLGSIREDYSKLNEQALVNEVQSVDWEEALAEVSNPTSLFDSFYNKISHIVDKHVPIKELSRKEKTSPGQAMGNRWHKSSYSNQK